MLELFFSSKLDWGSYIAVLLKLSLEALIRVLKFFSPEVARCFYKSAIQSNCSINGLLQ